MTRLEHRITSDGPLPPCDDCGCTFLGSPIGECPARLRSALDEANAEVERLRGELVTTKRHVMDLRDAIGAESDSVEHSANLAHGLHVRVAGLEATIAKLRDEWRAEVDDIRAELANQRDAAEAEAERLRSLLGACYVAAGADTDGDPPERHADFAVGAVEDLRRDYDELLHEPTAADERARIVAWLRTYDEASTHDEVARDLATRIERGQHHE